MVDAAHLFERAIAANPSDPTARHWYSFNLARYGHVKPALEEICAAKAIDPLITAVISSEAQYLQIGGDYEAAAALYREAAALGMGSGEGRAVRAEALAGNHENVAEVLSRMQEGRGKDLSAHGYAALEKPDQVSDFLAFVEASGPFEGYFIRGSLGESLAALGSPQGFESFGGDACGLIPFSVWSERFRPLRATPKFWDWMERWGVVDYWREFGWPDDCESLDPDRAECPAEGTPGPNRTGAPTVSR